MAELWPLHTLMMHQQSVQVQVCGLTQVSQARAGTPVQVTSPVGDLVYKKSMKERIKNTKFNE